MRQKVFNLKNTPQLLKLVVALCLGASHSTVEAQVHNNGSLHVAANGVLFVNSSPMTFGATSTTTTSKATTYAATDGKIILLYFIIIIFFHIFFLLIFFHFRSLRWFQSFFLCD